MPVKTLSSYYNWKPQLSLTIKDKRIAEIIHEIGYVTVPFLGPEEVKEIRELYEREHHIKAETGGMFYTLYSKDLDYRERMHNAIAKILKPKLDEYFSDYKNIVNTFINKLSGPESEFVTHQDMTGLDEFKYTAISVWIPMQDMTLENGPLAVIEKSHWFFSPYRGVTFPFPFKKIINSTKKYLKPILLKAGEAIVFDARMIHNSLGNSSGKDRLAVLCGIFPKEADFITCYKDESDPKSHIELYKQPEGYTLKNERFFYDCHAKPENGVRIKRIKEDFPEMDLATFEKLCLINNIKEVKHVPAIDSVQCNMIAEPDGVNRPSEPVVRIPPNPSVWQRMKKVFN